MRTTLDIAEDVLAAARTLAAERGLSIGAALSELARRGLQDRTPGMSSGLPVFEVGDDVGPITPDMVREANEDA